MLEVAEAYSFQVLDLSPEILKMKLLKPILAGLRGPDAEMLKKKLPRPILARLWP